MDLTVGPASGRSTQTHLNTCPHQVEDRPEAGPTFVAAVQRRPWRAPHWLTAEPVNQWHPSPLTPAALPPHRPG